MNEAQLREENEFLRSMTETFVTTVEALNLTVEKLLDLIDQFVDADPCQYDHHDLCQAHHLHERPCPHETAKEILAAREAQS